MTAVLTVALLFVSPVAPANPTPGVEGVPAARLSVPAQPYLTPPRVWTDTALSLTFDVPPPVEGEGGPLVALAQEVTPAPSHPEPPPSLSDAQLYRLRMCESTDDYRAHLVWGTQWESRATGGYQFEQPTWDGVARRHMPWLVGVKPHHASPADQDAMARWLWSERGRYPWPVCGLRVGAA